MPTDRFIIPSPDSNYTFLSRTQSGKLFKKHILSKGSFRNPETGEPVVVDDAFIATMQKNHADKICPIVQFPMADAQNRHTEAVLDNGGEVLDIQVEGDKVYAVVDVRDEVVASKVGKTILGASAFLSTNYTDTKTGEKVGPTLLHVCATNRPYLTELDDYSEIVAATATADDTNKPVLLTAESEKVMPQTKEELLAALRDEHGIDVVDLQSKVTKVGENEKTIADLQTKVTEGEAVKVELETKVAEGEKVAASAAALLTQLNDSGVIKLTGGSEGESIISDDVTDAIVELANTNKSLVTDVAALKADADALKLTNAQVEVDALVKEGRVTPAQKDTFVELKLSNPTMFGKLVPEKPLVRMEQEQGITPTEREAAEKRRGDELTRLSNTYAADLGIK